MSYIWVTLLLLILWVFDVSTLLTPYITPLSQSIILLFYLRAQLKWNYRGRVKYREENWEKKTYSRMSFKTVWFFPIWLLFCWLASENTWYLISLLYLAQLLIGINFPRIEYRMTKDTPEGWALREYARKEFSEDKNEEWFYKQLYLPHMRNKTHEYYWWWQMQGERWIFRIKAFSQFTRDIIACILIPIITIPCAAFSVWIDLCRYNDKFSMEGINFFTDLFIPILLILMWAYVYVFDNWYQRYHAWNYFFDYKKCREKKYLGTEGPRLEDPYRDWEYYYVILRGLLPKKYRDLIDEEEEKRRKALGIHWLADEDPEAADDAEDAETGAGEGDLDDYDAVGGVDYSDDYVAKQKEADDDDDEAYKHEDENDEFRFTKTKRDTYNKDSTEDDHRRWRAQWEKERKEKELKQAQQKEQEEKEQEEQAAEDRKFQDWKEKKKKS